MKISTRGRYAVRMVQDIAARRTDGYCTLKSIAERQDISLKYLEQIAKDMVKAGILETGHGRGGGYRIRGSAADYTVYDILCAAEESMSPVSCLEGEQNTCPRCDACVTLPIWTGLDRVVREYLTRFTIQDLLEQGDAMSCGV